MPADSQPSHLERQSVGCEACGRLYKSESPGDCEVCRDVKTCPDCGEVAVTVGHDPRHGDLYRCGCTATDLGPLFAAAAKVPLSGGIDPFRNRIRRLAP